MNQKAFTLFEIIIAMLIAGIVTALAAPKVLELVNEARAKEEAYTVGSIRTGIRLVYLGNIPKNILPLFPPILDNAVTAKASPTNPLFDIVLQMPIINRWEKLAARRYKGPTGQVYEYDPDDGSFEPISPPIIIPPFTTTFGGSGRDEGYTLIPTSDGGYIIAGITDSFGAGMNDVYLIKIDAYGNKLWEKTYGGSSDDGAMAIQETPDGGFIIAGVTGSFGAGNADAYLLKIDSSGNKLWEKTYGGIGADFTTSLQQTPDGGYILAGLTASSGAGGWDAYLIKVDSSGTTQWEKTYGGSASDQAWGVQLAPDGGYIIGGNTESFGAGGTDAYLIKVDSSGNTQWEKTYGGSGSEPFYWDPVRATSDGGYILMGSTESVGAGSWDGYLIKVDSSGNTQWESTFGGTGYDEFYGLQELPDGGYIVAGYTDSYGAGMGDAYLVKVDSSGNKLWEKSYGVSGGVDWFDSVQIAPDGGYIMSGSFNNTDPINYSGGDAWVLKTDADGNAPGVTGP